MKFRFSRKIFEKYSYIKFHEFRPVEAGLFRADGRTDMTKIIVAFRNSVNAPQNVKFTP